MSSLYSGGFTVCVYNNVLVRCVWGARHWCSVDGNVNDWVRQLDGSPLRVDGWWRSVSLRQDLTRLQQWWTRLRRSWDHTDIKSKDFFHGQVLVHEISHKNQSETKKKDLLELSTRIFYDELSLNTRIRGTQTQLKDGGIVLKLNSKNLCTIIFPDLTDPQHW